MCVDAVAGQNSQGRTTSKQAKLRDSRNLQATQKRREGHKELCGRISLRSEREIMSTNVQERDISTPEIEALNDSPKGVDSLQDLAGRKPKSSDRTLADLQREKQAEISQITEVLAADQLFEKAVPKLRALSEPNIYSEGQKPSTDHFMALLIELTTPGVEVSEGIPGVRGLWREIERATGNTNRSQYFVDPTEIRADVKYRMLTQLSQLSVNEVIFILTGVTDKETFGKMRNVDASHYATRQTFIRRVLRNSARTVMRRTRGWVGLEMLDREATNTRSAEEINAHVWDSKLGKRFSPKPWIAHLPLGKIDIAPRDLVDGSNGKVAPLVTGLANYWMKVAFLAAAPKFKKEVLEEAMKLASTHYINELNMLSAVDSATYPKGGPTHIPASTALANEAEYRPRWFLQTRTKYANRTMIPYLGQEGYVKKITGPVELVSNRLNEEAAKAMAHSYAGRLDCAEDRNPMPEKFGAWREMNRGDMRLEEGTVAYSSIPSKMKRVVDKELRRAISDPMALLETPPVSLPQKPKTATQMMFVDFIARQKDMEVVMQIAADRVAGMSEKEIMEKYEKIEARNALIKLGLRKDKVRKNQVA